MDEQSRQALRIVNDDEGWHGRITVDYNERMQPIQLTTAYVHSGELHDLTVRPVGPFDDLDDMVSTQVARLREIGKQLTLW